MKPRVLFLYYTFTNQTKRVADAMAEVFREQGCETQHCAIEFVDERYRIGLPFKPFWPKLLWWLWPQLRRKTGKVLIDPDVINGEFDLICIGSPTWWLHPAMPIMSFLKSDDARRLLEGKHFAVFAVCRAVWWNNVRLVKKMASQHGGKFVAAAALCFKGNDIQSALSFINYMRNGTERDRYWGVKIYEFGVSSEAIEKAKSFAGELAASLSVNTG